MDNKEKYDSIKKKIKKCLNIVNDNPNTEEAKTALFKAQSLIAKYDLDMSDLDFKEELKKDEIVDIEVTEPARRIANWKNKLAFVIADNFRCYTFLRPSNKYDLIKDKSYSYTQIVFLGRKTDVEIAKNVYLMTENYVIKSFNKFFKLNEEYYRKAFTMSDTSEKFTRYRAGLKNTYIFGFISGLVNGFKENISKNKFEIVLCKDNDLIEYYTDFSSKLRSCRKSGIKPTFSNDEYVRNKGYIEGFAYGSDKTKEKKLEND